MHRPTVMVKFFQLLVLRSFSMLHELFLKYAAEKSRMLQKRTFCKLLLMVWHSELSSARFENLKSL